MNNSIDFLKKEQRKIAIKKRLKISSLKNFNNEFIYNFINQNDIFKKSKVIASFISIKTEISTKKINNFVVLTDKILCLPSILENNKGVLIFKSYSEGDKLIQGKFGVPEPLDTKIYLPDIILVPCLAFDEYGHRLGYGGGYYDRSISYLNSIKHNFTTIGFAYDEQKVDNIAHNDYDQKLNYILTEKQLYKIL